MMPPALPASRYRATVRLQFTALPYSLSPSPINGPVVLNTELQIRAAVAISSSPNRPVSAKP